MTDEEVEAMRAADLARLEKGERAKILGCALRLAQATGCPEGEPVFPWLVKRGLAVEHDDGSYEIPRRAPSSPRCSQPKALVAEANERQDDRPNGTNRSV